MKSIFKLLIIFALLIPLVKVQAGSLSVRVSQPQSPTRTNHFDLSFVALDQDNNPVIVNCFKKGPSDGTYTQFASTINLAVGGGTAVCPVDSAILNQTGSYSFYVTANDSVNSDYVVVDFQTGGPDTPHDYSKEKLTSCDYKITFKTANDGKTIRVEGYRSDNAVNFDANSENRVVSLAISPDQKGEFVNSVPDCTKDYYFAVRAYDSAGNGSGLVGDTSTKVVYEGTISPTPATAGGALLVDRSQVNDVGQVLGEKITPTSGIEATGQEEGQVQGEKTVSSGQLSNPLPIIKKIALITGGLILLVLGFVFGINSLRH